MRNRVPAAAPTPAAGRSRWAAMAETDVACAPGSSPKPRRGVLSDSESVCPCTSQYGTSQYGGGPTLHQTLSPIAGSQGDAQLTWAEATQPAGGYSVALTFTGPTGGWS